MCIHNMYNFLGTSCYFFNNSCDIPVQVNLWFKYMGAFHGNWIFFYYLQHNTFEFLKIFMFLTVPIPKIFNGTATNVKKSRQGLCASLKACYKVPFKFYILSYVHISCTLTLPWLTVINSQATADAFRNPLFFFLGPWIKIGVFYVLWPAKSESGVYFDLKMAD